MTSFVHGYLLGGLVLIGIPILVHLIMREKPKRVLFPAFRFLQQSFHTNKRKLRLHQILLLILRMLVIALICIALARPRLFSDRLILFGQKQPVVVAFLFDTSSSMGYRSGNVTRLEEAKARAKELLKELPTGSSIAILDSASRGGQFITDESEILKTLDRLRIRPGNQPLTTQISWAYSQFQSQERNATSGTDPPPRFLYVFSDRTRACWSSDDAFTLKQPKDTLSLFVDVGVEKPVDFAVMNVEVKPELLKPGRKSTITTTIRLTNASSENVLQPRIGKQRLSKEPINPESGEEQSFLIEQQARKSGEKADAGLDLGFYQGVMQLQAPDQLTFNDRAYFSFQVQLGKKVLTIAQDVGALGLWEPAIRLTGFAPTVLSVNEVGDLTADELSKYDVVTLFELKEPSAKLWSTLKPFVEKGGGLLIVPPEVRNREAYASNEASLLMPGELKQIVELKESAEWDWNRGNRNYPILRQFYRWRQLPGIEFQSPDKTPLVTRYWQVTPSANQIQKPIPYPKTEHPVLLDRRVEKGRVVLLTVPMSNPEEESARWHRFWRSSFAIALIGESHRYLSGELTSPPMSFRCGAPIKVQLPSGPLSTSYTLYGPDFQSGKVLIPEKSSQTLVISDPLNPGNYQIDDRDKKQVAAFSVNVRPEESILDKVPTADLEKVLGEKSVVPVNHKTTLRSALQTRPQPMDLFPWLMLLLLLILAMENLISNRRRDDKAILPTAAPVPMNRMTVLTLSIGVGIVLGLAMDFFDINGSLGSPTATVLMGLLGLCHGLLMIGRFRPRDSIILGVILGSLIGILFGGLMLPLSGMMRVILGMLAGAAVFALDGWIVSRNATA